jgi:hypothetical protein
MSSPFRDFVSSIEALGLNSRYITIYHYDLWQYSTKKDNRLLSLIASLNKDQVLVCLFWGLKRKMLEDALIAEIQAMESLTLAHLSLFLSLERNERSFANFRVVALLTDEQVFVGSEFGVVTMSYVAMLLDIEVVEQHCDILRALPKGLSLEVLKTVLSLNRHQIYIFLQLPLKNKLLKV